MSPCLMRCRKCHTTGSIDCSECLDAARFKAYREEITRLTRELGEARSQRDGLVKATNNLCSIVNLAVHRGIGKDGPSEDDLKAYMKAALDAAKGGA